MNCWCFNCQVNQSLVQTIMIVCPDCGNKRCPKGTDHKLACSGSNEPGQPGSRYQATWINISLPIGDSK